MFGYVSLPIWLASIGWPELGTALPQLVLIFFIFFIHVWFIFRPDKNGNQTKLGPIVNRWINCTQCHFTAHASCLSTIGCIPEINSKKDLDSTIVQCKNHPGWFMNEKNIFWYWKSFNCGFISEMTLFSHLSVQSYNELLSNAMQDDALSLQQVPVQTRKLPWI